MSKQLHWKNWLLPLYCRLYILRKNHIQCKVKKAHTPTLSATKCKKNYNENVKNKKNWNSNKHDDLKQKIYNNNNIELY